MRGEKKFIPEYLTFLGVMLCTVTGWAHVGSPDVYVRGDAGPYAIYVSVHPPGTLPGAAEIDVREDGTAGAAIDAIEAIGSDGRPSSLRQFAAERSFVGSAWIPTTRLWKLRLRVRGSSGAGEMLVPVTLPSSMGTRGRWMGAIVFAGAGLVLLAAGFSLWRMRGWRGAAVLLLCGMVAMAASAHSAMRAARNTSLAPTMSVEWGDDGVLHVKLWRVAGGHALDDLTLDHGHMLHLFAIRQPQMDVVLHLHPVLVSAGRDVAEFTETMPPMAQGTFALFADIAHGDGIAETARTAADLPMETGHPLSGDDSSGVVSRSVGQGCGSSAVLPDGFHMTLECPAALRVKTGVLLRAELTDAAGHEPSNMENYIGMGGHAAIVSKDGAVYAHIHPMGTVMVADAMAGMAMPVSNTVEFPYGFPRAGSYRVFVQMKHGAVVETGAFDVAVN